MIGLRPALVSLFSVAAGMAQAQSFDVSVVKPHDPKTECTGSDLLPGGRFVASCWPLKELIQEAFDVLPNQISGGPSWIETQLWDITAKADGTAGEISYDRFRPMLRQLIQDKFQLAYRTETRILPVFVLTVMRNGTGSRLARNKGALHQFDLKPGPTLICRNVTMAQLGSWLKTFLFAERPVLDQTGLKGAYDFSLSWRPEPVQDLPNGGGPSIPAPNANGQALMAALREQLGLQVKSQRAPVDVLVLQRVEYPFDN